MSVTDLCLHSSALAALFCAAKKSGSAGSAGEEVFFGPNKRFGAQFPPAWNGAQNVDLALRHGEIFDFIAGETFTLMAAGVSLFPGATLNGANGAVPVNGIGKATSAIYFVRAVPVGSGQLFFQLFIAGSGCAIYAADTAVKTARGNQFPIHYSTLLCLIEKIVDVASL
jgi:hypothetical protein